MNATITLEQQIQCVRREIGMRQRVYPSFVAKGKMSQEKAELEIRSMIAVLATLERLTAPAAK